MGNVVKEFMKEFFAGIKESPRIYFSPITGAAKAIYREATSSENGKHQDSKIRHNTQSRNHQK